MLNQSVFSFTSFWLAQRHLIRFLQVTSRRANSFDIQITFEILIQCKDENWYCLVIQ